MFVKLDIISDLLVYLVYCVYGICMRNYMCFLRIKVFTLVLFLKLGVIRYNFIFVDKFYFIVVDLFLKLEE